MKKTVMVKKNYEFKVILKKGTCYRGNLFDIFVIRNNEKINRFGIAVSKKAGNSVKRNKIKRLIRESYKVLEENITTGIKLIILWKKKSDFENFDFYGIKNECENLFIKSKIYRG